MSDPQVPPTRGLVAGKYEILGLIGRGGMGSVWQGRHATLGTGVAIKFIDQEYIGSEEARSRFATEARAAATIQSRHAIQIFDYGVTDEGRPYIVMELLAGESLDKRLERLGHISLQETARILGQVARALQRAHDAGIIHRDLKPENIFLVRSPDDEDEIAKVLDFGIAKIKPPLGGGALSSSTKTGAVLGTPYFMSPEQARGLRTVDHRSDLWSLGVIAYKCVAGVLPFEGESVGDLLVKICTYPPPVPSEVVAGLPKAFDVWFLRVLERDPNGRYATATELGDALAFAAGPSSRQWPREASVADDEPRRPPLSQTSAMAAAGITSAPFTASVHAAQKRNTWLAVIGATLVGGSIGVVSVVKLMSPSAAAAVAPFPESGADPPSTISVPPPPPPVLEPAGSGPAAASPPPTPNPARPIVIAPKPAAHAGPLLPPPVKPTVPRPIAPAASGAPADPGY